MEKQLYLSIICIDCNHDRVIIAIKSPLYRLFYIIFLSTLNDFIILELLFMLFIKFNLISIIKRIFSTKILTQKNAMNIIIIEKK